MRKNLLKLFLLAAVLMMGVGVVNAAKYYKIRVVAVSAEGGVTPGKVYACGYGARNETPVWSSDITTGPWSDVYPNNASGYPDFYLKAQETEGAAFLGWYLDEALTTPVGRSATSLNSEQYGGAYTGDVTTFASEEEANAADPSQIKTYYAKFTSVEKTHYYAVLRHIPDENHLGAFRDYSVSPRVIRYSIPDVEKESSTYDASVTFKMIDLGVEAKRGYRFTEWTVTGDGWAWYKNRTYYATSKSCYIDITSNESDPENPEIITVKANYEPIPSSVLSITKGRNKGSVAVSYTNFIENEAGNGFELTGSTVSMEDFGMTEIQKTYAIYSTDKITLAATPNTAQGYVFQGWYSVDAEGNKTSVSTNAELVLSSIEEDRTYYANFILSLTEDDKFVVGGYIPCSTLDEAIVTATSMPNKVIRQVNDYTVPAGNYTIPAGVTLLIPCEEDQEELNLNIEKTDEEAVPIGAYRTLTLAAGAHLNVYGDIEVGGKQSTGTADAGGDIGIGCPAAPTYGLMILNEGSSITLNDGANFRAWGFVQGQGEIDARRGSTVREQFQMMDWRGYEYTSRMFNNHKVLPLTQYFIQNIESPTIYHPGAKLLTCAGVRATVSGFPLPISAQLDTVGVIGARYNSSFVKDDAAIFLMDNEDDSEDTWVRKYYDPTTDRQVYEINNAAYLGSLELTFRTEFLGGFEKTVNSCEYVLPITNNFKIHLLNGEMIVTQNTVMLPGSEIELDKKSTVTIPDTAALYFYDTDQWDKYVCGHFVNKTTYQFTYASRIKYRPGGVPGNEVRDISSAAALGNAKLTVHGTVNVEGQLFTTESGASITSTKEDAGTIFFRNGAPAFSTDHFVEQVSSTTPTYVKAQCVSALLTNEAGSTYGAKTATAETAPGQSFCFIDLNGDGKGEWISMTDDELRCMAYDQYGVYYIKPNSYVPISSGAPSEETDHTFRDHYAGTDSIYIKTLGCQWWCVYPVEEHPDLFECRHKDNHTFYYYDEHEENWMEKKFKVEWENWDGKPVKYKPLEGDSINYYMVTYGTVPQWLSANPTRPDNANYSYTFAGWSPAFAPVTEDVKYVAQYTETPRKFLITFKNAAGVELETTSYDYLAMPTPPEADLTTYQWSPAIGAVTGNQVYQLVAKPEKFTVIYKNWDGEVLQTTSNITSGTATPTAPTATKTADALYSYTFDAWSPAPAATVTADAIYTATYTRGPRSYTIRFLGEGGSPVLSSTSLAYGATPTPPTGEGTTKASTDEKTYTLVWSPLVGTVVGNQDYTATFTEQTRQYRVDWKDEDDHIFETKYVDWHATPVYSGVTPTKASDANYAYTFREWDRAFETVESDQTYVAQFDQVQLEMNVASEQTVNSKVTVQTITIEPNGKLTANPGATITADELILESTGNASGQLDANVVNIANAYFDWTPNGETGTLSRTWYAIAVPWEVNAETGIFLKETGRHLVIGQDFDLIYYDGAERASQGNKPGCWKYVQNQSDKIMHPGQLYMMYFDPGFKTIRFAKKSGSAVIYNSPVNVSLFPESTGNENKDANWNGIANPRTYYASLSAGSATYAQVLNNGNLDDYFANPGAPVYQTINLAASKFTVGKPLFVQATQATPVVVTKQTTAGIVNAAPRRAAAELPKGIAAVYRLAIAGEGEPEADNLFVQVAEDEKADRYTIGQDLVKGGVASGRAQVWVNRYDAKLSVNTQALSEDEATYPLTIQVPANGGYVLSVGANENEDYALYLTRDGEAIWNLSEGAYTANLEKGAHTNYGLRVSARAPQIATGIDEAVVDAKGETRKVMINDKVFIIRGENVYSVDGQLVK